MAAISAQGAASASTLLLSVAVARSGGASGLGELAVVLAVYLLAQVCVRDGVITPALTRDYSDRFHPGIARRVSAVALGVGALCLGVGFLVSSAMLVVLGFALHGLLLLDFSKVMSVTYFGGRVAVTQEVVVLLAVGVALAGSAFAQWSAVVVFCVWALVAAVVGYGCSVLQSFSLLPGWRSSREEALVSGSFATQAILGRGSVHVLTMLIPVVADTATAGVLRGGSTILGPANLTLTSLQPLLVRRLSESTRTAHRTRIASLIRDAGLLVATYVLIASCMLLVAHYFGHIILGEVWTDLQPLMWIMFFDGLMVAISFLPLTFHRSTLSHRRSMNISIFTLLLRFPGVLVGAAAWGAKGAALGYLATTFITGVIWWVSCFSISRKC